MLAIDPDNASDILKWSIAPQPNLCTIKGMDDIVHVNTTLQ